MLLKGVNKRVIIIKNPESEIFEEAYFIVKSDKGFFKQAKENEMVMEANRIISDYSRQQKNLTEKEKPGKSDKPDASDISDIPNVSDVSDISDSAISDTFGTSGNISGMTAEIDRFLNDKIQKLDKTGKKNNEKPKIPQSDINPNLISDLSNLTDDDIFEDENFFADFENTENNKNNPNSSNNINNLNNTNEPDYYTHAFDYLPTSIISDISNVSNINGISDIYGSNPKFKLISSKKSNKSGKSKKSGKPAFSLPPKSFFAGIGFMSAVIIAIRILEFLFSK